LLANLSVTHFIWMFTISFSWWCESGSNITISLNLLRSSGLKCLRTYTNKHVFMSANQHVA
jgi:hypothetical protein